MKRFFKNRRISVAVFFLFSFSLFSAFPFSGNSAGSAIVSLSPGSGTFLVGSTFDVSIVLDTKGIAVNTAEIELMFPSDKLQLTNPSVGQSIIQLNLRPPVFSNREGKIYFVGGIPSPGIVTSKGVILTLTFRITAPGSAEIKFGDRTKVLANDGKGTNILGQTPSAFYRFSVPPPEGPAISSPTHPDQERWYRDPNPIFLWPKGEFASAYSYSIDHDPAGFPDTKEDGSAPAASYQNLESGIWYFHLRELAGANWGGVSHYVIKIDLDPPASFKVSVSPSKRTSNRNPIFRFFTTDSLSGFDHFELKIIPLVAGKLGEALFFETISPYQFTSFEPGRYQVIVRALDRAGNTRDEGVALTILGLKDTFITPEGIDFVIFVIPWLWLFLILALLVMITGIVLILAWRRHKRHIEKISTLSNTQ